MAIENYSYQCPKRAAPDRHDGNEKKTNKEKG